ncbi:phospho-N-acetylmuramoyl-pentapeptide-transferase [Candidatus Blochmannia ocreatus (nom. nud.)]|uniref:Phospho-N-acetylmuramoyl-pentapeptide-transferase n=1 Tax=Candidatus Blochmannia ocreatus (nom. nud.) TaxID=251538 RepID=A0ABY4STA9_9ENTR|nr:phospho-N-acetylmuramoyl-pentapeptide-transferase [Candidatus Blochmannia ocreatus]URJ25221.1 phospho-N-acetylmuramoyl-pentapeptide-transferase [Candidatus Blochmannia ocreatus]
MLFWLFENIFISFSLDLHTTYSILIRSIISFFSALLLSLSIGKYLIIRLHNLCFYQIIRCDGPKSHIKKQNIPTMGGIIILFAIIVSIMLWSNLSNLYVWYVLFILTTYGFLGFVDDYLKIKRKNTVGLQPRYKYFWQTLIALTLIFVMFLTDTSIIPTQIVIPLLKNCELKLCFFLAIIFAYFAIVGSSNAVNLSDGLDGLVIVPIIFITTGFSIIAYITSNINFSNFLHIPYLHCARELIIVCTSIIGASLGFLWFNAYPARVFMGDVGSLSLGGTLGAISVLLRQELLLLIMGGLFVIETISVVLQISFFKLFKIRIFKMAPIHHHFELIHCPEPRIVVRYWIISVILMLLGLIILLINRW